MYIFKGQFVNFLWNSISTTKYTNFTKSSREEKFYIFFVLKQNVNFLLIGCKKILNKNQTNKNKNTI